MKSGPCPKCNGREVYEIEDQQSPEWDTRNSVQSVALTAAYGPYGEYMKDTRIVVHASVYVCATCGYAEHYARNLDVLERLARAGAGSVTKGKR